jgi:hypothetical protein
VIQRFSSPDAITEHMDEAVAVLRDLARRVPDLAALEQITELTVSGALLSEERRYAR